MPPRKKKQSAHFRKFVYLSVFASIAFISYLGFLWWKTRELKFVRYEAFGIPMPTSYQIHGIDVSRYQQRISWEAVKAMQVRDIRISFAFIKATEGTANTDPYFSRNWKKAKEAGITRGAYHFFIPSRDGTKQAQNFMKRVVLESGDLPPVLDIETTNGASSETIRREVKEWLDALEARYSVKPIIYTNVDFYNHFLKGYFDDYPLWVAHYLQPHKPRIKRDWVFWQHSERGRVNGISSKVDFNVFSGDTSEFRALLVP
jgi:lysozyme